MTGQLLLRPEESDAARPYGRMLTEADAIDIWIARWLRIRLKDLIARYRCDPRRLYEIWSGDRFPDARTKALAMFERRHPGLAARVDLGNHRRRPKKPEPGLQGDLFE